MPETFRNFIDGEWCGAASRETFENRDPAHPGTVVGTSPRSAKPEVEAAVGAARRAFRSWSLTPAPRRAQLVAKLGALMARDKPAIARLATREMGKVLLEAGGDVQEGIDCAELAAGEGRRMYGETTPSELPSKFAMTVRRPVGVAALITPWNFPMAIPCWKMLPALVCGNTVVLKPAMETPGTATWLCKLAEEAGFPKGVVNLVHGGGPDCGELLATHPEVNVVSFTGSSAVGRHLATACGSSLKRVSLELGQNSQIVLEDADLDLALEGALWGAFGTTGQRCTATSRLIVHEKVLDEFVSKLVARARALRLGDGLDPATQVGPLVSRRALEKVEGYVQIGRREDGAELLTGGERAAPAGAPEGYFFQPTIFGGVEPGMRIAREEIFGPVVAVLKIGSLEEAIDVANRVDYGLSSSIYTRDVARAFVAMRDIEAGITYVNGPTIGAEVHLPFGGVKQTGNGHREAGRTVLDIFTEWKSIYVDYSGKLQRAQID